ncbi:N-acetylmuramoyl-L-alanine amidase [Ferruginibacter sp. HRS2-29]|uniref:N-acetylmuramoyl-L-alanine amidase n=1 Tax=Ferruginibacter sp. HRS2-29 TaxID=2487334 RepID=UPI0020CFD1E7|nr:N-acetylmuramoyl-L-alanine amidase [Ferruginibacter sp. HRS2-29]MCP9751380.1 hypothetical protein [Ferruginibacter sp. HRS2-29]
MLPFIYYLLKVITCSIVLYGYYWFFLRNKVFHHYNRFYLLAVLVLSLTLPMLKFNIWQENKVAETGVIKMLQVVDTTDQYMDVVIYSNSNHISKEQIALWVFVAVSMFFALAFFRTLLKIWSLKKNNPTLEYEGISLINTTDKSTPFSFLKNIFWNDAINMNTDNGGRILRHELAHVEQKHSHDKLFINIVLIFFWCNPIFWLLRKELNMIHEFTADKKAVENGDTAAFAAMILQAAYPHHQLALANNFFYSPIKRRLAMLTKNNQKVSYISRLLVLPLAAIVFAAFTFKTQKTIIPGTTKTLTVVLDAGHGGTDNGALARSASLYEKELNLNLVKKIKSLNTNSSINILLLRESDIYQSPKEKAALAARMGADLFISIHGNSGPGTDQTEKSGLEVFVAKDNYANTAQSKLFASAIISSFKSGFGLPVAENPMQATTGVWILQEAACPAVIIEAGYMNNKKDVAYLNSEEGQEKFARNLLAAIYRFAENINGRPDASASLTAGDTRVSQEILKVEERKKTGPEFTSSDGNKVVLEGNATLVRVAPTDSRHNDTFHINASEKGFSPDRNIIIRGNGQAEPLYVLDGAIIEKADLSQLNPNTIKEVNVLKGSSAVGKYGDKAKDGVIEIRTKSEKLPVTEYRKTPGKVAPDTISWSADTR